MGRVIVIGIDGATFDLLEPWAETGELPSIARMLDEGAYGELTSTLPPVTSPAWPTFATGKNPGKHGVFDFIRPMGGRFDLVNATSIQAKTIWQILSDREKMVGVMNVPVTYPPSEVNGFLISGMLSPSGGDCSYPSGFVRDYEDRLGPYRVAPNVQYKEGNEQEFLDDALDLVDLRARYAKALMEDHPSDFFMVHFQAPDVMQHALWRFIDPSHPRYNPQAAERVIPKFKAVFKRIDAFIGYVLERWGEEATVIVMSDHGFGPLHNVVNLNLFFLEKGLLQLKSGFWARIRAALFRAGVTPAAVWEWIERAGLQNYVWQVSKSTRNKIVGKFLSFEDVDWSQTVAYSIGHVGQVYINLKGREPDGIVEPGANYREVRQRTIDALKELKDPRTGERLVSEIIPADEVVHGPHARRSPDLHLVLDDYRTIAFPLFAADGRIVTKQIRGDSGCHRRNGVLLMSGKGVREGFAVDGAHIMDLAPTILHLVGTPVPSDMDGRPLVSALDMEAPVEYVGEDERENSDGTGLSAEDAAEVEDRLRSLGYLS